MKDESRPVHELEHATPTVIRHTDEDMTIMARWLQRGMDQGPRFWVLLVGSTAALLAVAAFLGSLTLGASANGQAWIDLIPASTAEAKLKVADAHPDTLVANSARLLAAQIEFGNGLEALIDPKQRDLLAKTRLDKALDLFRQVAKDSPKDSPQARGAAFGVARTLEARNDLSDAIKQYKLVAETYRESPEGKQSLVLAKALEDPENVAFYKELYAYKPPATATGTTIPEIPAPGKIPGVNTDLFPPTTSPSTKPTIPPDPKDLGELAAPPATTAPPALPGTGKEAPAPKPETPKAELPVDPLSPPK